MYIKTFGEQVFFRVENDGSICDCTVHSRVSRSYRHRNLEFLEIIGTKEVVETVGEREVGSTI